MSTLALKALCRSHGLLINQDGPVSPLPSPKMEHNSAGIRKRKRSARSDKPDRFKYFLDLPYEIQCEIARFISFRDMCNLQISSKLLRQISSENLIWKSLYQNHWKITDNIMMEFGSSIKNWQAHFKLQYCVYQKSLIQSEKLICASKPQSRFAHTSAVYQNHIYYVGGQMVEGRSNEVWDYDVKANSFSKIEIANHDPSRTVNQMNIDDDCINFEGVDGKIPSFARHQSVIYGDKVYTFGGYDYTYFYNLAVFDITNRTWTYPKVKGDIPVPRSNHSSAIVGNKFYVFGGSVGDNVDKYTVTNDFYCLDIPTLTWKKINTDHCPETPSQRVGHVMAAIGKHIYLFGGGVWGKVTGWTHQYNDLYIYSTEENNWSLVACKPEEKPAVCTYPYVFTIKNNLCIFGGASITGSTVTNKLYLWDTVVRKWTELEVGGEAISARSIGSANLVDDEIVIWGGYCGGLLPQDNDFFRFKLNFPCNLNCVGMS